MPPPIDPERLLAQTAWVRRLARSLVRDEASADDLVQDTFVAALRRPPPNAEQDAGLRAWIAHVLRNLAFRRKRDEYRREQRERQRSSPGHTDEEARARELEELRAELFEHVVALPESSRQVVLLRFFEELDSAEIARRLAIPDSTVRNRLQRALAELRERLERKHGSEWRNLCLFVLPTSGVRSAAAGATIAAAGGLWFAGGSLALLAVLAWIAWPRAPLAEPAAPLLSHGESSPSRTEASVAGADSNVASARREEPSAEPSPPSTFPQDGGAALLRVSGSVLDERARPVPEFAMSWYDEQGIRHRPTVAPGRFELTRASPGKWIVALDGAGLRSEQFDVELDGRQLESERDFRVRSTVFLPVRLLDRSGMPLALDSNAGVHPLLDRLGVFTSRAAPPAILPGLALRDAGRFRGCARFWNRFSLSQCPAGAQSDLQPGCLGLLELFEDPPLHVALVDGTAVITERQLKDATQEIAFTLSEEEFRARLDATRAGLRLRVVLPGGSRIPPDGRIAVRCTEPRTMHLDRDGRGELLDLPPGACLVSANLPGFGRLQLERELEAGAVLDLGDLTLLPEQKLRIQFVLPDDANNFVRFCLRRQVAGDPQRTLLGLEGTEQRAFKRGRVEIPWPGSGSFVLCVLGIGEVPPEGETVVRNDYHAGARPLRLDLGDVPAGDVVIQIEHTHDVILRPPRDSTGSARWLLATDDGLPFRRLVTEGRTPLTIDLPPGGYAISSIDGQTGALGTPQPFSVGSTLVMLELVP
jgi:RNA polymerase sigma-70 factor (ECF subfamily)